MDPNHPYSSLTNIDQLLWEEFRKYFPSEFNKILVASGVKMADFAEFVESRGKSQLSKILQSKAGVLSKDLQLMHIWQQYMGMSVNTIIDFGVEYGNKDDPTKPVVVSRYYGSKGVVYKVEHQSAGSSYRTLAEQFLQNPESLKGLLEPIRNAFEDPHLILAFNEKGNEVYTMYRCKTSISTDS